MNYGDFKLLVAAAAQRSASSFLVGDTDLLAVAINLVRKQVERRRDFELAKETADLTVTIGASADLANAKYAGTSTSIVVKTILSAQISTDGVSFVPIEVSNRAKHVQSSLRRYEQAADIQEFVDTQPTSTHKFQLIRYGDSVYLSPSDTDSYSGATTVTVRMDIVRWLDEYNSVDDTDFLLEHCTDYMLLETLKFLQYFVKEDVRVDISEAQLAKAWQGVIAWDANLVLTGDDMNLE